MWRFSKMLNETQQPVNELSASTQAFTARSSTSMASSPATNPTSIDAVRLHRREHPLQSAGTGHPGADRRARRVPGQRHGHGAPVRQHGRQAGMEAARSGRCSVALFHPAGDRREHVLRRRRQAGEVPVEPADGAGRHAHHCQDAIVSNLDLGDLRARRQRHRRQSPVRHDAKRPDGAAPPLIQQPGCPHQADQHHAGAQRGAGCDRPLHRLGRAPHDQSRATHPGRPDPTGDRGAQRDGPARARGAGIGLPQLRADRHAMAGPAELSGLRRRRRQRSGEHHVQGARRVVPVYLINSTMESYFQRGNQPAGPLEEDDRLPAGSFADGTREPVTPDRTVVFGTESCTGLPLLGRGRRRVQARRERPSPRRRQRRPDPDLRQERELRADRQFRLRVQLQLKARSLPFR